MACCAMAPAGAAMERRKMERMKTENDIGRGRVTGPLEAAKFARWNSCVPRDFRSRENDPAWSYPVKPSPGEPAALLQAAIIAAKHPAPVGNSRAARCLASGNQPFYHDILIKGNLNHFKVILSNFLMNCLALKFLQPLGNGGVGMFNRVEITLKWQMTAFAGAIFDFSAPVLNFKIAQRRSRLYTEGLLPVSIYRKDAVMELIS